MKKVYSKTEARYNLPNLIDRVREGTESIYITDRGQKSAVLISYENFLKINTTAQNKKRKKFGDSSLFGLWKNRTDIKNSVDFVNKMRKEEEERSYKAPSARDSESVPSLMLQFGLWLKPIS